MAIFVLFALYIYCKFVKFKLKIKKNGSRNMEKGVSKQGRFQRML